jgi:hypothetical protein
VQIGAHGRGVLQLCHYLLFGERSLEFDYALSKAKRWKCGKLVRDKQMLPWPQRHSKKISARQTDVQAMIGFCVSAQKS